MGDPVLSWSHDQRTLNSFDASRGRSMMLLSLFPRFLRSLCVHLEKTPPAKLVSKAAATSPSRRTGLLVRHSMVWELGMVSFGLTCAVICDADARAQTPAAITAPSPGSVLSGSSVTFSWTT